MFFVLVVNPGSNSEETKWLSVGAVYGHRICSKGSGILQLWAGLHVRYTICHLIRDC